MSTITTSSLYKKTRGSKSNATILENGTHMRKHFEVFLIHKLKKRLMHEVIPSLLDFIFTFFVLGI